MLTLFSHNFPFLDSKVFFIGKQWGIFLMFFSIDNTEIRYSTIPKKKYIWEKNIIIVKFLYLQIGIIFIKLNCGK